MDPREEMEREAKAALEESEKITLAIVEGKRVSRDGSVHAEFDKAKEKALATVEMESRESPPIARAPAVYPIAQPLSLSDFRERLELCAQHGVECYEDATIKIKFLPGVRQQKESREPHVNEKW